MAKQTGHLRLQRFVTSIMAKRGVGFVFGADAAVEWAALVFLGAGVFYAFAVEAELLRPHVLVIVGPVKFLERAVLWGMSF